MLWKTVIQNLANVLVCLFCICGCSLFAPHDEFLTVVTEPPGARVDIEGVYHTSPARTKVRRDRTFHIYVDKPGYTPQKAWCGRTISATGVLDLAGTLLFYLPAVGFFSPGVWKHDQTYFKFYLKPIEPCPECAARRKTINGCQQDAYRSSDRPE